LAPKYLLLKAVVTTDITQKVCVFGGRWGGRGEIGERGRVRERNSGWKMHADFAKYATSAQKILYCYWYIYYIL